MSTAPAALWVDDVSEDVRNCGTLIVEIEQDDFDVNYAEDYQAALEEAKRKKFQVFLIDIKLGSGGDGIELAREIRRKNRLVPILFVSSYQDENSERIQSVPNIQKVIKKQDLVGNELEFAQSVRVHSERYKRYVELGLDSLTYSEFQGNECRDEELSMHSDYNEKWAQDYLALNGMAWLALCGDKVIAESDTLSDFPDTRTLEEWAERYDRIPFVYSRQITSEERGDRKDETLPYYPKVAILVNGVDSDADLDTGTNRTLVSQNCVGQKHPLRRYRKHMHLGEVFYFFDERVEVGLRCSSGQRVKVYLTVAVVKDWYSSPWTIVRPDRDALLGRDIFLYFSGIVQIDAEGRSATISFIRLRER